LVFGEECLALALDAFEFVVEWPDLLAEGIGALTSGRHLGLENIPSFKVTVKVGGSLEPGLHALEVRVFREHALQFAEGDFDFRGHSDRW
jgi:hypothetical protein